MSCTLHKWTFSCPLPSCTLQKPTFTYPLNDALHRNTHSHASVINALKRNTSPCPLPWLYYTVIHIHRHINIFHSRETHIHMFTAKTALLIIHIYRHIAYLTVQKLNFTCLLLYCTLEKQTFTCPLPSLHSTLTQIHMPTSVPVSKKKHIHFATVILQFTDTKSHAHCHHCTLQ